MSEQRLNQVIAVEQSFKGQVEKTMTDSYHLLQQKAAFDGMTRTYRPSVDGGDKLPPESKKVQHVADDVLKTAIEKLSELFNMTATKDFANCVARADVKIDGETLLVGAPPTFLLFLEKQLVQVHTLISKLPTLDPAETWVEDANDRLFKTEKVTKNRTQKTPRVIVKIPATVEHPGQAEIIHEDLTVGVWEETRLSGAYRLAEQKRLLARVEALQVAVKKAREAANMQAAPEQEVGAKIFQWLFA